MTQRKFDPPDVTPDWAQSVHQRSSGLYEGVCEHGVGHPIGEYPYPYGIHGCDGCCLKTSKPTWITTNRRRRFDLKQPRSQDVDITEIAHSLSNLCRYTGHCDDFYSVAEHSLLVAEFVRPELKKHARLHDAHEAFTGDLSSPMKWLMPPQVRAWWDSMVEPIQEAIHTALGLLPLSDGEKAEIKRADLMALAIEKDDLLPGSEPWAILKDVEFTPRRLRCLTPIEGKREFLREFYRS